MKYTGIKRRVDDLGRLVIPREIRRILKIREGDATEHPDMPITEERFLGGE